MRAATSKVQNSAQVGLSLSASKFQRILFVFYTISVEVQKNGLAYNKACIVKLFTVVISCEL